MGMFDYVHCERPLPDGWKADELQTKDFPYPYLEHYTINKDGRLIHSERRKSPGTDKNFHGMLNFYGIEGDPNEDGSRWHEYRAKFTDGKLDYIDLVENRPIGEHG